MNRILVLVYATILALLSSTTSTFAQQEEWVELEKFEEIYQLVKDAPSVVFNDRIYRFEIASTDHYTDNQLVELVVWSSEFRPDLYVREAISPNGKAGNGEIIVRGEYQKEVFNGQRNHVVRLSFRPPETGDYRFVLTSMHDISELSLASTGTFNLSGALFEWQLPEVEEPQPISLGCNIAETDASPEQWEDGEYGGVWTRDYEHNNISMRTIRIMGLNMSWAKAQESKENLQNLYSDMAFVDMMTRFEACEYISNLECSHTDSFQQYCSEFGFTAKPELYAR